MDKTELLSKYLYDIHCKQLNPFYGEDDPHPWNDLAEKSSELNDIDKTFFRTIAKDITLMIKSEPDFATRLPKILYEIHASRLPPYYISFADDIIYTNDPEDDHSKDDWSTLEE